VTTGAVWLIVSLGSSCCAAVNFQRSTKTQVRRSARLRQ